jgi:UDP-GlcNAc:undecaprenyl-phosphate/decaprenyl-phosphate GlcNAc-1-phosphate transferase
VPLVSEIIIATTLSFVGTAALIRLLPRFGLLDVPNERSSHDCPTVRGGGLAPAIGAVVAMLLSTQAGGPMRAALMLTATAFGLLGLFEDLKGVHPLSRLVAQVVIAASALPVLIDDLGGAVGWRVVFATGCVIWLVAYVNAFNFMDGIDGISVFQTIVAAGAWMWLADLNDVEVLKSGAAIAGGAAIGFAPFNLPRARIFLGDVGSYFLGGWLAILLVIGLRADIRPEAMIAPVAIYLADTGVTLIKKLRAGAAFHLPHRNHAYQRLVQNGWSHFMASSFFLACAGACSLLGMITTDSSAAARLLADVGITAIVIGYLLAPQLVSRARKRPVLA